MTWTEKVITSTVGGDAIQVLNDGRILIMGTTDSAVWSPDQYGSYANGSMTTGTLKHLNPTDRHFGGAIILENNGKVSRWGGHTQYDGSAADQVEVFNPKTNTWDESHTIGNINHNFGGGANWNEQFGAVTRFGATVARYNNGSIITGLGGATGGGESGFALIPSGGRVQFPCSSNLVSGTTVTIRKVAPDGTDSAVIVNRPSSNPRAWYWERSGDLPHYCIPTNYMASNGIFRELGPAIYMPKIGKVAQIAGGDGTMWLFDPVTNELSISSATMPIVNSPIVNYSFALHSSHNGQTISQLASGAIQLVADLAGGLGPAYADAVTIKTASGKAVSIKATSLRLNGFNWPTNSTTKAMPGDIVELVSPVVRFGPTNDTVATGARAQRDGVLSAGAEIYCAITPDGNLVHIIGYNEPSWISSSSTGYIGIFDGSTWVEESADTPLYEGGTANNVQMTVAPSGELLVCTQNYLYIRSAPTEQHEAARPVIDRSTANVLVPGYGFTLAGYQLHGLHVGSSMGDDSETRCNHPVVRLTSKIDGRVYFCPTTEYSYRGIQPMRHSTCRVDVPLAVPKGPYSMHVISAGNASQPRDVYVDQIVGGGIAINQFDRFG